MERRVTSHTEEEEMNQRRRLLTLARKGDQKSIDLLFELYQVKVFSGDELKKKKLPSFPVLKPSNGFGKGGSKGSLKKAQTSKKSLADTKGKEEARKNQKSGSGGSSKIQSKTAAVKPLSKKSPKLTLKKNSGVKKASPSKKTAPGKLAKPQKLGAAKKPRIAKKK